MNFIYQHWIFFVVPFLYGMMLVIEFASQFSRVAGFFIEKNAIGYSLQNATFTCTRFFSVLLMPLIGFMVDSNLSPEHYIICVLISYFFVSFLGVIVYLARYRICLFYIKLINSYIETGSIIKSILNVIKEPKKYKYENTVITEMKRFKIDIRYFSISCFVYCIHAVGVFLTFYFALISPTNKIMITQTSGVINAFATVLLTFKIDPALSVAIERKENFISAFLSIFLGRIFVFLLLAPLIIISTFLATR
ncbi:DUF2837 family protein [Budviciaceae bacterium CWB-B4]|uniref:DUF2837 family protein n=1 Tax=Limnobaculum xujianqingii TaxID=2738837 RepID=A0A9D7FZ83_9GAMM|nr:DUF2837 family protein [Limnobaculum xujianqingii]MBK5074429.1 DUF2837 family protein [Limnobaculum xujianqingii]MBK5177905.1 DUF2837 family protein [Limnobaculum xujianqingii]